MEAGRVSTLQQGRERVRKGLTGRKESGTWVRALLKTGSSKGTMGAGLDEEGAKQAKVLKGKVQTC